MFTCRRDCYSGCAGVSRNRVHDSAGVADRSADRRVGARVVHGDADVCCGAVLADNGVFVELGGGGRRGRRRRCGSERSLRLGRRGDCTY